MRLDGFCTRCCLIGIHIWKSKIWNLVFNFTFVMMYKFLLDDSVGLLVLLKEYKVRCNVHRHIFYLSVRVFGK